MPPPLFLFLLPLLLVPSVGTASSFSLDFFPTTGAAAQLALSGGANATAAAVEMPSAGARQQSAEGLFWICNEITEK
jgi:hypothetical protein